MAVRNPDKDIARAKSLVRQLVLAVNWSSNDVALAEGVLHDKGVRVRALAMAWLDSEFDATRREVAHAIERAAYEEREAENERQRNTPEAIADAERREQKHQQRLRDIDAEMHAKIHVALDTYAAELKMQWTAELLDTEFALGDGRRVLWGDATIGDHEQRISMLTRSAQGTLETAARHTAAVIELKASEYDTLRELVNEL